MVYIWAWQAAECPPDLLISSMITEAWVRLSPRPPYSVGMSAASRPAPVRVSTNSCG
jgi:hypothetical protein